MEHTDKIENNEILPKEKKDNLRMYTNLLFVLAIIIASVSMVFTINTLLKNKEIIQQDPITYAMNQMNFTSCNCVMSFEENVAKCYCLDKDGKDWTGGGFSYIRTVSRADKFKEDLGLDINLP